MGGAWGYLASSGAALAVGIAVAGLLIILRKHRDANGRVHRVRIAAVFGLAASTYTFIVCVIAQLVFHDPTIVQIIGEGFGGERIAWLLALVAADSSLRVWDEFH